MAYEQKPLSGVLFKNDKQSDNQPDYTGTVADASGKQWRLAAWIKDGKNGKFISLKMSEPRDATAGAPARAEAEPAGGGELEDEMPFAAETR